MALIGLGMCVGLVLGGTLEWLLVGDQDLDIGIVFGMVAGGSFGLWLGFVVDRQLAREHGREAAGGEGRPDAARPWLDLEARRQYADEAFGDEQAVAARATISDTHIAAGRFRLRMSPYGRELEAMRQQMEQRRETLPAADGMIQALPTHKVTAEEAASAPEEHRCCTICIEEFKRGEEQRTLPCFHRFHAACVDRWLRRCGTCPICKSRVDSGLQAL